ncbi:putative acetyltransferase (GNAT) domain containing protein [Lyophyllum shimeji]|uniref:Acetyltransferase (GNAT) domain containing protein n=1 Tax=Lyophyllum shimeji TaxID=47721 RepID=A0A9P3UIM7_LYOSH|nr:putative acetyltransferase (GNAT) domain containing protein [Lyophyllum shimeji]
MANSQLYPLEVNPRTGEPFLRLKNHKTIIITPPRQEDTALYPAIMNDPRIYEWLGSPPSPYTADHAEAWYARVKATSDGALKDLEAAQESSDLILVGDCPVRAIREMKEDGTDIFIGDIGIMRSAGGKLMAPADADDDQKAKHAEENAARKLGDPKIAWTVGYYIIPSYHGRGIMTDALQTLLWEWAVPRMGVRYIVASAFEGNEGSLGVFRKNGFVQTRIIENHIETRGQWRNLTVMEWNMPGAEARPNSDSPDQ